MVLVVKYLMKYCSTKSKDSTVESFLVKSTEGPLAGAKQITTVGHQTFADHFTT